MIYYTGDIHGSKFEVVRLAKKFNLTKDDIIVILGDAGINYFGNEQDNELKEIFSQLKPTIFCIHGNHEIRPHNIPSYITKVWNGGTVWYEEAYPNILFAKVGEIYDMEGIKHLVIGGAYSVDKFYRIARGYGWWADEQPSNEIKKYVERQIKEKEFDIILSHTCPYKYEPREMFISGIDQSTVDTSTEMWLDEIEETIDYKAWYCGHWHKVSSDSTDNDIHSIMNNLKNIKEEAYNMVKLAINKIKNGEIVDIEGIEDFKYLLMDYGDDYRFFELYKSLCQVLKEKYPQLVNDKWFDKLLKNN